jgi:hypothetical protein
VFAELRKSGERFRAENRDVLTETQIDGITASGSSSMTIRTSTRVQPGRQDTIATALRLLINESFDGEFSCVPRKTLIGDKYLKRAASAPVPT